MCSGSEERSGGSSSDVPLRRDAVRLEAAGLPTSGVGSEAGVAQTMLRRFASLV